MILKRLAINQLPGIREPFEIETAGRGIHVIFGPNGIGKSSICRAIEGLYWDDRGPSRQTSVNGEFELGGDMWRAEREGAVVRWRREHESNASPRLPASHNYHCFFLHLRDLVDMSPKSTVDIASEIRRQMSGGFDLDGIALELFPPVTHRRKRNERNKFNDASSAVQEQERHQAGLQQRSDKLKQLKTQLEGAQTAASRLVHVERAIELAECREELAGISEQLGALPGVLADLTGKEGDEVEGYQKDLNTLKDRARELESDLRAARAEQEASALASPLEPADLAAWREYGDELGRFEQVLGEARANRRGARNRLDSAVKAVGGRKVETVGQSLPERGKLFEFLRESHSHNTRAAIIRERLRLIKGIDMPEESERDLDKFRSAAETLRSWLRAPQSRSLTARLRARRSWLLLALALLTVGAALAFAIHPLLALISAVGAGIGLAAWLPGAERSFKGQRRTAEAIYRELELEEPTRWDVTSVGVTLRNLENRAAKLEGSLQRARYRDVERTSLENELDGMADQGNVLEARRQELKATLGLESLSPDAEMVDFARALDLLRQARSEHEAIAGKVQGYESSHAARLEELADVLEHHGDARPGNATEAKARLNKLVDRNAQLQKALDAKRAAERQLDQNTADREKVAADLSGIYAKAKLGDGDSRGLASLLETLPKYRSLKGQSDRLAGQIDVYCTELEKAGESGLCEKDRKLLRELKADLTKTATQEDQLRREVAEVKAEVERAKHGNEVLKLIADRENARENLGELRDKTLFATAGALLIAEVEKEYEHTQLPRVFERARDHFSAFTRHNYELRLEKGNGTPRLFAIELRGRQTRELQELSDGTRAQLLLAARIAFAEEVEQGEVLPLFLDEALDQSDPERFEAIVRSIGRVAQDQGRQIFYLTSDPLDVQRFRNALNKEECNIAAEIDLGAVRNGAASIGGLQEIRVAPAPTIPAPNGVTPEEYGATLRVSRFRPVLGFAEQHMFYVLWDDLELLHRFLTNGIERAGQWKTVADTPLAGKLGSRSITTAQIGSRLDLLKIFCELWKQGRGKPVDQDALADSNAVSTRYLEDVIAIAKELNGDPERLLDMLDRRGDDRLKGFRERGVERLRSYLAEKEYLDDRPVLTESQLQLLCLAAPAANDLPGTVAIECVRRWWAWSRASSP